MIQLFKKIEILENELEDLKNNSVIIDYRLFLQINNEISLYIICDDDNIFQDYLSDDNINLDIVGTQEVESDRFYRNLFADDNEKIDVKTTKRNFTNILGNNNLDNYNPPCPLVTFYGYKGGMGCSSTLAVAASYLALRKNKKVVILDCDFESPGFANFFLEEPFSNEHKNGFVEYIFDNEFSENKPNLDNYLRKVSDNYSGKGEIYIMPAGNLDDEIQTGKLFDTHRKHYLEGLARIDFASTEHTVDIFHNLIEDIYEEIKPDVILIDSKSGFNDILGITALKTSNLIVGFFSNNIQNLPGLHFFIDLLHNTDKEDFNGIIMNSFSYRKAFNKFETQIESYINKITDSEEEVKNTKTIEIKKFFFGRHSVLEKIGTFDEDKEDFIDFINYSIEKGFIDLNEEICKQIENTKIIKIKKVIEIPRKKIVDDNIYNFNEKNNDKLSVKVVGRIELGRRNGGIPEERKLKKEILKNLKDANIGDNLYAGRVIDFDKELATQKYFFRECMTELFSLNKKLIIGSKGTGKTYTYLSLKNDDIVNELKRKAGKTNYEYVFFHMVDHKNDLFINTDGFDNYDIENQEAFYEKFWLLYNWNAIMKIAEEKELGYKSTINILYSKNNIETLKEYFDIINDDNKITEIEKDLEDFDNYLKTTLNKYIILLYDDLDELVNPNKWYLKTVHLFNFWEKNKYDKMFPKFFVRKNLLENISGIDNIVKLESRAINLEWQKKEIQTKQVSSKRISLKCPRAITPPGLILTCVASWKSTQSHMIQI